MDIEKHIREIRSGIEERQFINEASITQGVVLRILQALAWPCWDTHVVIPQYPINGRRADFALCHPADRPIILVEVKQLGMAIPASERQLFEYTFHLGVPLVVLTDGQQWHFFLPAEQGDYEERRVYKLDLLERTVSECASQLQRYLKYDYIISGEAIEAARQDYQNVARDRFIKRALPKAWRKLIDEKDDILVELLADQVATICGYKPDIETVAQFLEENLSITDQISSSQRHTVKKIRHINSFSEEEPEYIRKYREMLKNPNSLPSKMRMYIEEIGTLSWGELKKVCVQKFGCKNETSGSIGASLRVLERDGYVITKGKGKNKKIFSAISETKTY